MSNFIKALSQQFETILPFLPGTGDPLLRKLRQDALQYAKTLNVPNPKLPTWKYAKLDPLFTTVPKLHKHRSPIQDLSFLSTLLVSVDNALSLVFVNGFYDPSLSQHSKTKVTVKHFRTMIETQDVLLEELIENSTHSKSFFHQLNAALVNDGALIIIPADYNVEQPILITHFLVDHGDHNYWVSPQTHIYVEKNAHANIIENTIVLSSGVSCINSQTAISLQPHAICHYLRIEESNPMGYSFSNVHISQFESSKLIVNACTLNGGYHRLEIENNLNEKNAYYSLNGLMLPRAGNHHDWVSKLHHLSPACESSQSVKSIIDNDGHGSYLGLITVNPQAVKTNASMDNHHLLLSENGTADSSPQFEILCDDVKCNHGSTTAQLEQDLIFYLQSRGLEFSDASAMLLTSYITPFIQTIHDETCRKWTEKCIMQIIDKMIREQYHER